MAPSFQSQLLSPRFLDQSQKSTMNTIVVYWEGMWWNSCTKENHHFQIFGFDQPLLSHKTSVVSMISSSSKIIKHQSSLFYQSFREQIMYADDYVIYLKTKNDTQSRRNKLFKRMTGVYVRQELRSHLTLSANLSDSHNQWSQELLSRLKSSSKTIHGFIQKFQAPIMQQASKPEPIITK